MSESRAITVPNEDVTIGLVSVAHFFSHVYIMAVPPLVVLMVVAYDISYTALGLGIAIFNGVTTIGQVYAGVLVDRHGARGILIAGLALEAAAIGLIGVFPSYYAYLVLMLVAGVANCVFHPADYAILAARVSAQRLGRAFGVHTFAGNIGMAIAAFALPQIAALWSLQGAFVVMGAAGLACAIALWLARDALVHHGARALGPGDAAPTSSIGIFTQRAVIMCLVFFVLLAIGMGAVQIYTVAALVAMLDAPLSYANNGLTGFLVATALGILIGGVLADRTAAHDRLAVGGFAVTALLLAAIPLVGSLWPALVLLVGAGFTFGVVQPSRDMMVRAVAPADAIGRVFGFVSVGFSIGGTVTPVLFGWVLDRGAPALVFWLAALAALIAIVAVRAVGTPAQKRK